MFSTHTRVHGIELSVPGWGVTKEFIIYRTKRRETKGDALRVFAFTLLDCAVSRCSSDLHTVSDTIRSTTFERVISINMQVASGLL